MENPVTTGIAYLALCVGAPMLIGFVLGWVSCVKFFGINQKGEKL